MMGRLAAPVLAWGLWAASLVALGGSVVLALRTPPVSAVDQYDPVAGGVWTASWVGFGLVGALIVSRRPRNRIGWVLAGITFGVALALLGPAYARVALLTDPGTLPFGHVAAWLGAWTFIPTLGLVVALVLLFPTGTLRSLPQRVLAWTLAAVVAGAAVVYALRPGPIEGDGPPVNPAGLAPLARPLHQAALGLGWALALTAALVLFDAVARYRRARGVERQQFRWFALAALAFPLLFLFALVAEDALIGSVGFDPVVVVFFLCGNGLATAVGIAVTRHGLYDIDRIVSRTLAYALVSGALTAIYAGAVVALNALLPLADDSPLTVAAATLAAAAAFNPLRRRVQAGVDRRFNRARYDAARTVEAFGARLRDATDPDALAADLLTAVQASMQPARTALWLRSGAGPARLTGDGS